MRTGTDIEEALGEILRARSPLARNRALANDLPLGAGGLGLDSIALVELLLDCEARFGGRPADLLTGPPLTIGSLLACLRAAGRS
ncbi:MAG TPA: phosphopantetheine-binding protein [Thermoanaerobaculia bacterium]|jgi:acyl carrier protein